MSGLTTALIFFLVVVPLSLLVSQFFGRYVKSYRLTDRSILIVLFGVLPVRRIGYDSIKEIRKASFSEIIFSPFEFVVASGNRSWGSTVLIRRKGQFAVMITPDDADEFIKEVRRRLPREDQ